jgi:aspartyl-tRNA(Asn)/glutamyl-tRNA(Gln) amidotransferase subunit A
MRDLAVGDARIHAFLMVDAQAAARARDVPLSPVNGMLIGVKANIAVRGWPFHAGIGAWRDRIATRDAACVARLRDGGAVLLGLLNMDEAALGDTCDNAFFGRTENPLRPGFTAGGSSGGAGAAVAAGFCAAALGTDTLGSVRIPAAYCGVVGHKPPHGAVSTEGVVPLAPWLDTVGIVAATPEIAGTVRDWLGPVVGRDGDLDGAIGMYPVDDEDVCAAMRDALAGVVDKAERCGLVVRRMEKLAQSLHDIARAAFLMVAVSAAEMLATERARTPAGFSDGFLKTLAWAENQPAARRRSAKEVLAKAAEEIRDAFAPYAAVLMPTTPQPAFAFGATRPRNTADFTSLANIAGLAATAFPAGLREGGVPLSVQAVGADEAACLALARRLAE